MRSGLTNSEHQLIRSAASQIRLGSEAERSVEAIEAIQQREQQAFGVDNRHNKRQGEPCRGCALRTRCGGAWNAYWDVREGRGLEPPLQRLEPWHSGAEALPGQHVVAARSLPESPVGAFDGVASAPATRWFMTSTLGPGDGEALRRNGMTDVAILTTVTAFNAAHDMRRELQAIGTANAARVTEAFRIITSDANVKAILVNIFGGIAKCDMIATGIVEASKNLSLSVPLVVRLEGTNVEQGKAILRDSGLNVVTAADMADGAQKIVALSRATGQA